MNSGRQNHPQNRKVESKATPGGQKSNQCDLQWTKKASKATQRRAKVTPRGAKKLWALRGPWAWSMPGVPVRGKEFLPETPGSRFAIVKSTSCK